MEQTISQIPHQEIKSIGVQIVKSIAGAEGKSLLPNTHSNATVLDVAGYAVIEFLCDLIQGSGRPELWNEAKDYALTLVFPHIENPTSDTDCVEIVDEDVQMYGLMLHGMIKKVLKGGDASAGINIEVCVGGLVYGAVGCLVASHSLKTAREIVLSRLCQCSEHLPAH